MAMLDATVVNVALPHIGRDLDAGVSDLQWVLTGYLLALASLILVGGALGDRYGRRRVFVVGTAWFAVASLACGLAPNVGLLVTARVLQGVGGALLTPGSLAIIQASFRERDRAPAVGAWSGLGGIAGAIGPLVGGFLVDGPGWRWAFLVNVPVAALVIVCARDRYPSRAIRRRDGSTSPGAAIAVVTLAASTWALTESGPRGWDDASVVLAAVVALVGGAAFVVRMLRAHDPLVPPALFPDRTFTVTNLATFLLYGALGVTFFLVAYQLQVGAGWSALSSGLALLPVTVLMLVLSAPSGALAQRIGPRPQLTVGPLLAASGLLLLTRVGTDAEWLTDVLPGAVVFGAGLVTFVAPLTATVMAAADQRHVSVASGVNNAIARAASLTALAVIPAVAGLAGAAGPAAVTAAAHTALVIAAALAAARRARRLRGARPAGARRPVRASRHVCGRRRTAPARPGALSASPTEPPHEPRVPGRVRRRRHATPPSTRCRAACRTRRGHDGARRPRVAVDGRAVLGELVASGAADLGVLMCWTGTGTAIAANKVHGVRAAQASDPWIARGARLWNDANVLTLSLKRLTPDRRGRLPRRVPRHHRARSGRSPGHRAAALDRRRSRAGQQSVGSGRWQPRSRSRDCASRTATSTPSAASPSRSTAGEIVAVLGPNGAGKTTTIEMLEGYREPDAGTVRVLGFEPATGGRRVPRARRHRAAGVRHLPVPLGGGGAADARRRTTTTRVRWTRRSSSSASPRSGTHASRRSPAASNGDSTWRSGIVGDPELLFLDEPTTGFDPSARRQAWDARPPPARPRQDGAAHHPLHGRGAGARRPRHRDRRRRDHRRGHARRSRRAGARPAPPSASRGRSTTPLDDLPVPARTGRRGRRAIETDDRDRATLHGLTAGRSIGDIDLDGLTVTRPSLEDVYLDARSATTTERRIVKAGARRSAVRQVGWEQRQFWRNPASAAFTFAFPLLFLVVFIGINGNDKVHLPAGTVKFAQFYVPAIVAFGIISACYTNLAFNLSIRRENGLLKRVRGTPLPPAALPRRITGNVIVVSTILTVLVIVLGVVAYGVTFPGRYLALVLTLVLGAVRASARAGRWSRRSCPTRTPRRRSSTSSSSRCCSSRARSAASSRHRRWGASPSLFPVFHLNKLLEGIFNPTPGENGLSASHLGVLAAWMVGALVVAVLRFRWEPNRT